MKTSLPATRSGSAGPRSGRSSSTPSKVRRPRSRSPSIAAAKPSSRSSGTSIIRALAPSTVSIAVRHRASSGATSTSSATKGSSSTLDPARPRDLRTQLVHPGRHPAGAALQRRPLAAQLGLALAERELVAEHRVALAPDPLLLPLEAGQPLLGVHLQHGERLARQQRGLDVGRLGVGDVDERQQPPLQDLPAPEPVLADDLLLLQRQRERLERRAAGRAVRLLGGLEVGQVGALRGGRRAQLVGGRRAVGAVVDHGGLDEAEVGAQQPHPQRGVTVERHAVGVELREPPGGRHLAVVEVGDRRQQLELLLLGAHGGVRGVEVVEVLDRAVGGGERRGPLEHHVLVELVDAADLVARLDPGEQAQGLRTVAVGTDAEPRVQDRGELGVRPVHPDAGVELLQRVGVEALGHGDLERVERQRPVLGGQLHLDVGRSGWRAAARSRCGAP